MKKLLTTLAVSGALAVSANAAVIFVVDAEGPTFPQAGNTSDESTDGDIATGLTGSVTTSAATSFSGGPASDYWGAENGGFLQSGIATWTVTGYTPGTSVDVYVKWRSIGQGNNDAAAQYSVNGGTAVVLDQTQAISTAPASGNLVLNDGANDLGFVFVGSGVADGTGQVQLTYAHQGGFGVVDAAAFVIPEPSSTALVGLAGLGLLLRRRK